MLHIIFINKQIHCDISESSIVFCNEVTRKRESSRFY